MQKTRPTRKKVARPVKHHRRATSPRPKSTAAITLNEADSREFLKMLERPARAPNELLKAMKADHRRLIQG